MGKCRYNEMTFGFYIYSEAKGKKRCGCCWKGKEDVMVHSEDFDIF